jgi:AraC-like DNA-binding protein
MAKVVSLKLSRHASTQHKLTKLCEWIDANIDKQIDSSELVKQSGLSYFELQTQFKSFYKTSPMQWIRTKRQSDSTKTKRDEMMHVSVPTSLAVS